MSGSGTNKKAGKRAQKRSFWSFIRKRDGSITIEFALLGPLFFVMAFGVIEIALISLGNTSVRAGLSDISRDIRTGRAQCVSDQDVVEAVCRFSLVSYCQSDMRIEQSVIGAGGANSVDSVEELNAGDIVLMRATYPWRIITPALYPFLGDETRTLDISSSIVFRSENFDDQTCS